ncbi:Maltase A1 [Blattella germanica]|nr:Maltase A1 [Blattella germanica]
MRILLSVVFAILFSVVAVTSQEEPLDWWKTAIFYQIYPRSFKDSDGDGVGDLKGITEKLDYLVDLGVTAVWLSPIFKSPMADFGYDISDFKNIDEIFGTLDDFANLQRRAKELGLKLVLDLVPNHSSDEHEWFQKSISLFMGSTWEWNEERQQYYLHEFVKKQPDLNYRIPYLFEDEQLRDNPPSNDPTAVPGEFSSLLPTYIANLPETHDMISQWRELFEDVQAELGGDSRVMLLEVVPNVNTTFTYYGNATHPEGHLPFNFFFQTVTNESSALDIRDVVKLWMDRMIDDRWPNWVVGNHDSHRIGSRFSPELVDGLNMYTLLLPGTAITYNGEEIGMLDTFITWEETQDPAGINAENQKLAERSHYKVYKDLVQARKTATIQRGALLIEALTEGILAFSRDSLPTKNLRVYPKESFVLVDKLL